MRMVTVTANKIERRPKLYFDDINADINADIDADIDATPALVGRVATDVLRRTLPRRPGQAGTRGGHRHRRSARLSHRRPLHRRGQRRRYRDHDPQLRQRPGRESRSDALEAAQHKARALVAHPEWARLIYQPVTSFENLLGCRIGRLHGC